MTISKVIEISSKKNLLSFKMRRTCWSEEKYVSINLKCQAVFHPDRDFDAFSLSEAIAEDWELIV